jgi:type VI secretion system protein ImpC
LGLRITDAFAKYGWTTAIRGVEGGGKVSDMLASTYKTDEGDVVLKCPTEVTITDRREKELNDLGFIAVVNSKGSNFAAFFGGQTTNKPKVYNLDAANANASLSARLPYILAASRFAHYLKVMMRDKIGGFQTRAGVSDYLNNWLADYVLLSTNATQEIKARLPLAEGRVDVVEVPGKPGVYQATVFLKPHFQMEELTASIRLVAQLPAAAA